MITNFTLMVFNDNTSHDAPNLYTLNVYKSFEEAMSASKFFNKPWQIIRCDEYNGDEISTIIAPNADVHYCIYPDCDNWTDYDTLHDSLQSAVCEANLCMKREGCECPITQYIETTVARSKA